MKRFKDIFCVVETGDAYKPALERTVTLAENNLANLTVVDVVESGICQGKSLSSHRPTSL